MCCASCSAVVLDSTTHACMVLADAFPRPLLLERSDCHVKVVGTLKDNVCGQGKGFTMDNVCSNVLQSGRGLDVQLDLQEEQRCPTTAVLALICTGHLFVLSGRRVSCALPLTALLC